jgi:hypothetical protein
MSTNDPGFAPGTDPSLTPDLNAPSADAVGKDDADSARRDLRAEVGKYVSLVKFPTTAEDLIAAAEGKGAPAQVTDLLRGLRPGASFATTRDVWDALGLESTGRF